MESFDQSLKYLLHLEPADFIRFGLRDPTLQVLRPVESALPSRGRDVDGGYLFQRGDQHRVAHIEFHRRHQSVEDLALDGGATRHLCHLCQRRGTIRRYRLELPGPTARCQGGART